VTATTENRVQGWIDGVSIQMYVSDCPNCGVIYGITRDYENRRREDGRNFYCPNGHSGSFGESEIAKAQRLQAAAERRANSAQIRASAAYDQAKAAHRSASAYRGQVTRMKNKIAAGVCPVGTCRRPFNNVKAHIATQHPTWAHEHPEVLA
jgi:predicted RNA-binding Zn-ribbon protein involved in translation (DUF1610 family)